MNTAPGWAHRLECAGWRAIWAAASEKQSKIRPYVDQCYGKRKLCDMVRGPLNEITLVLRDIDFTPASSTYRHHNLYSRTQRIKN